VTSAADCQAVLLAECRRILMRGATFEHKSVGQSIVATSQDDCTAAFKESCVGTLADAQSAALSARSWQRLSAGAGAHGPREYHWARTTIEDGARPGRGHWLLARRSLHDPDEIAYYACYGPRRSRLIDLAWVAGSRWHIEECFQQAKSEAGLDHYQVRTWRAWYAHITLSMLALAWLSAARAQAAKGEPQPAT